MKIHILGAEYGCIWQAHLTYKWCGQTQSAAPVMIMLLVWPVDQSISVLEPRPRGQYSCLSPVLHAFCHEQFATEMLFHWLTRVRSQEWKIYRAKQLPVKIFKSQLINQSFPAVLFDSRMWFLEDSSVGAGRIWSRDLCPKRWQNQ